MLAHLGMVPLVHNDHARAERYFEEALARSREVGHGYIGILSLYNLALIAQVRGDHERAGRLYAEGLKLSVEVSDKVEAAYCLEGLAELAASRDEPGRAARLFGASEALLETVGSPLYAHARDRSLYERAVAEVCAAVGEAAFEAARSEGRQMTFERAVEYALGEEETLTPAAPEEPTPGGPSDALTDREREVAILIARGLTDRQISSELSISERTVHNHVRKILKKLDLRSRAQLAAWVAERRPRDVGGRD